MVKKKRPNAGLDDKKPIAPDPDRSWEKIFLTDDPDHDIENEARSFQIWMDRELSEIRPFAMVDREHHHSIRSHSAGSGRKLKPGRDVWETAPTIDLHGLNREQALKICSTFLAESRHDGIRWVKIIVGKGHHSEGGQAVLRDAVESYLSHLKKSDGSVDWVWEQKEKNKSGALLVFLRGR